jgi:hypothetical protein
MMQTATVDIRRLQILNDSINRTIDALNQVRLSVYGAVTPNTLGVTPGIGGLAHAAAQNPFVASQLANQFAANPFATNQFGNPFTSSFANVTNPFNNPYAQLGAAGLGHTAFGSAFADPYATARVAQTFPFIHWGYSPFGGWGTI